jgi:hypothetical protein
MGPKLANRENLAIVGPMFAQPSSTAPLSCSVCGSRDARTLSSTALASGAIVVVCGSHAVAHARESRPARTVAELRTLLSERRASRDRRDGHDGRLGEPDELAQGLAAAFADDRRGPGLRRADT